MKRLDRYKFLQIFGDGLNHSWWEVIFLGCQHLKMRQPIFEKDIFSRALITGLIVQVDTNRTLLVKQQSDYQLDKRDYEYKITAKGDSCLREEQIARDGDISYYKNYDRTVHGKYGLNHFAPITPNLNGHNHHQSR